MEKKKLKVCVHSGVFHADDVLCVALVHIGNPDADVEIVRTRDPKEFEDADLVMDVGMKHDGVKFFEHHQEDVPVYENGIKYAACGLYLENMISLSPSVKKYILERALYGVQAQDNGQDVNPKEYPNPFTFVSLYNCDWKTGVFGEEQEKMFESAVIIAESVLKCIIRDAELEEEADEKIESVIENARKTPISFGGVIDIGDYCPWVKTVIEYNQYRGAGQVKAVVFKNAKGEYQCQVVPKRHDSFEAWCSIPEEVSEYPGFIFRHKAAFLAGFTSHDSAIRCAYAAVKNS